MARFLCGRIESLGDFRALLDAHTLGKIFRIMLIQPNLDCNYPFPIELAPIGIPISIKSIGKGYLKSKPGLD